MEKIEAIINKWKSERVDKIEWGSLYARNPIAHKWKAPYRSLVLRELVAWRLLELLEEMIFLVKNNQILGARILLRSAFETLSILIHVNQKTVTLLEGKISYKDFELTTLKLVLGSRQSYSKYESKNIVTILEKCDKRYPGIFEIYKDLSETSHPSFEGMSIGFSEIDEKNLVTHFRNRWKEHYSKGLEHLTETCLKTFDLEYNDVWPENFEALELWLVKNDDNLSKQ